MAYKFRCTCPITSALDVLGDKWILVLIKQMLMEGKRTFKDFVESEEAISTNILSAKLKLLEDTGMVTKSKLPNNKKTNIYTLTEKAIALAPVIVELALWSDRHLRDIHPSIDDGENLALLREDKGVFTRMLVTQYQTKENDHGSTED